MKVSISRMKLFKACRRAYQFKYIEKLEPVQKAEALETGSEYHELVEWINEHGSFDGVEEDWSKEQAMASAYYRYIYPNLPKIKSAEEWVGCSIGDDGDELIGRVDALTVDGEVVEHKTTSSEINEEYEYNLQWDEQILAYMLCTGCRKIYYTVCRKPTIRQKKDETEEEFFHRMVEWYNEDTDSKIKIIEIVRTDEEVLRFKLDFAQELKELKNASLMYRNCQHCFRWGRQCEYAPICLNYDPNQEYIGFVKGDKE